MDSINNTIFPPTDYNTLESNIYYTDFLENENNNSNSINNLSHLLIPSIKEWFNSIKQGSLLSIPLHNYLDTKDLQEKSNDFICN